MKHQFFYFCLLTSIIFFRVVLKAEKDFNRLVDQRIYIRGVQCNFSETFVYPNYTCYAKSYNRSFSTINVKATFKQPLNKIFVSMKIHYRYGTIYREVMKFPRFEFCKLMDLGTSNKLIEVVFRSINITSPGLLHRCPYNYIDIKDQPIVASTIPSMIPSGDYKMTFSWSFENGIWFQHTTDYLTVESPLKESFGK